MAYVDGFVLPIPKKNVAAYKKMATLAGKVWMEHGALSYFECMGDDVPPGKVTSFYTAVKCKKDEVPWFSWIVYESKAARNKINKKVMADPRLAGMDPKQMPFDGKRMIFGGFKPMVVKEK
jgi:uncharacterized protein YbaA (DUF1428 family)